MENNENNIELEDRLIETIDENGNVITFELYDIIEVDEQEYALVLPTEQDEDSDDEDAEIVLMRLSKNGDDYLFETIEDDEEFNKVAAYVESLDEDIEEDEE